MNHTFNNTNISNLTPQTNPWKESGAMIYVAFTVATFSALTMCCVWFFKQKWLRPTNYTSLNETEDVELVGGRKDSSSSEEEISLDDENDNATPDSSKFTLEDSDDEKQPDEQPDAV